MCGRYSFVPTEFHLEHDLGAFSFSEVTEVPAAMARYNIAPTQQALVIASDAPEKIQEMYWGLVPPWSKDTSQAGRLINARAEGIDTKPSFRHAFKTQHCIVPADSFYEWRDEGQKRKTPYRIYRPDGHLLFFAGLWETWKDPATGAQRRTFTIITTSPNNDVSTLHNRMPVILPHKTDQQAWLNSSEPEESLSLLRTLPDGLLTFYPVSDELNTPKNDHRGLHEAVKNRPTLFDS